MSEMSFAYHRLAMGELNSQHIMLLVDLIGTISWSKKIVAPSCRHAQCLFRYVKVRNIPSFSSIYDQTNDFPINYSFINHLVEC